ncbi:MAG: acyl-CoA dehydrogenase family protein, partial [Acidimicrobiales bacterium]
PDGSPNGFDIKRLKPKLGTVGVPTGEVTLDGARAWLAGGNSETADQSAARDGRGINRMMEMVNSSRFGVALMGLGIHRRSFLEAAIYAAHRTQWGQRIDRYPLVRETLVDLLVDLEAGMSITFECAGALRGAAEPDEARLVRRILIPLAKMRSTRVALWAASNALEIFGGNGYMHDWPIARQLRDAQCHTIWEGTENILAIDVRRSIRGEQAHLALAKRIDRALEAGSGHRSLDAARDIVATTRRGAWEVIDAMADAPEDEALLKSRRLAELLADTSEAALLLEEAAWSLDHDGDARKAAIARRFVSRRLADAPLRGLLVDDRTVLDHFEPLIRYGAIDPGALAA